MKVFKITGKVVNRDTREGIKGLRVEAWDKDLLVDDMVGSAITGEGGVFRIQFDESYYKELFLDRKPDLFFKVFRGEKLIKSTRDSVLWNVDREDIEMTIEVEDSEGVVTPDVIPSKGVETRSILQATYTPRKPRPQEEPVMFRATRGLEKGAFLANLALSQEELSELANRYKKAPRGKHVKVEAVTQKVLKTVEVAADALSRTGKIDVLHDGKQFAGLAPDALIQFAEDLIDLRKKKLTTSQIHRLHNLVDTFKKNMETEPVGYLHLERMSFTPVGIERGRLVHSVPLSPNEEVNIKHREWSHTSEEFERIVTDYLEEFSEEGVTEKTELAQAVNSQSQHQQGYNMGVTVSGEAFGVKISSSSGYNASDSASKSEQFTRNHSRDLTNKASSRSKKEHKFSFRVTSVRETEDEAVQRIKNPFSDRATRVDYYQLMRKWQVDLYRYGIRLTYDIAIPEPGSGLLTKILEIKKIKKELNKEFDLTAILGINSPDDISLDPADEHYYNKLAPLQLPETPPVLYDKLFHAFYEVIHDSTHCHGGWPNENVFTKEEKITIPEQYQIDYKDPDRGLSLVPTQTWRVAGGNCDHYIYDITILEYGAVYSLKGGNDQHYQDMEELFDTWGYDTKWTNPDQPGEADNYDEKDFPVAHFERNQSDEAGRALKGYKGEINVFVYAWNMYKIGYHLEIPIRLLPQIEVDWKQKIWNACEEYYSSQYYEKRRLLKERLAELQEELGAQDALSLRQREREEVMKGVLEALGIPPEKHREGWAIKFIHHAIEWENMLYFLYPYFWSDPDKKIDGDNEQEHPYWEFKKYLDHPDPTHRAFLKAGAARVVLTIRPGFENAFMTFVNDPSAPPEALPPAPYLEIGKEFEAYAKTNYPGIQAANPFENYRPLLTRKQRQAWDKMQLLIRLLEVYYRINGRYPYTESGEDLTVLRDCFPFKDPWGHDYVYNFPGQHETNKYDLLSYGADGQPGGDGINADITNWDPAFPKEYPEQVQASRDIELIDLLLEEYRKVHGSFPEDLSELKELIPLKDAWGNDYEYRCPGQYLDYDLVSHGANGEPGGQGEDADITNWAEASLIGQWYEYTPTSALDIAFDEEMPKA